MGAGKTSVGRRVAGRLGRRFVDADRAIEEHAGMTIAEIFPKKGEVWFRRTEEAVIREIIGQDDAGVLALGGGALMSARTRGLVHRVADVVWLCASPEAAWDRVAGSDRPLAVDRDRFLRRSAAREAGYREAAHLEVDGDLPLDDVVARVATWALSRSPEGERAGS
jgi:shikimate kinase